MRDVILSGMLYALIRGAMKCAYWHTKSFFEVGKVLKTVFLLQSFRRERKQ